MGGSIDRTTHKAADVPLHVPRQRHAEALVPLRAGAGVRRRRGPVHVPAASQLEIRIHRHAHGLHILQVPRALGCGVWVWVRVETGLDWGLGAVVDGNLHGMGWDSGRTKASVTPQTGSRTVDRQDGRRGRHGAGSACVCLYVRVRVRWKVNGRMRSIDWPFLVALNAGAVGGGTGGARVQPISSLPRSLF